MNTTTLRNRIDRLFDRAGRRHDDGEPSGESSVVLTCTATDQGHALQRAQAAGAHSLAFVPTAGSPLTIETGIEPTPREAPVHLCVFQLPVTRGAIARAVLSGALPPLKVRSSYDSTRPADATSHLTADQLRTLITLLSRDGEPEINPEDFGALDDRTPVDLLGTATFLVGGVAVHSLAVEPEDLPR
jgi:hypothetical protein